MERMKKRARFEETGISKEYLQEIHNLHEEWLLHQNEHVLIVDGEEEFEMNESRSK